VEDLNETWTAGCQAGSLRGLADLAGDDACAVLERCAAGLGLRVAYRKNGRSVLTWPDGTDSEPWREDYPYQRKLGRKSYEVLKRSLQIELLKLQRSVKASGQRLIIVFEGRDAAGKGGTIRRFTENLNPRGVRVVALEKPAAHEHGANYLCRYLMGFCRPDEYQQFLRDAPDFEQMLADDGVRLIKLWFSVTRAEQLRRLIDRQRDPVKRWKLSAVDLASLAKWDEYTAAKQAMFARTDLPHAPWTTVKGNDKKRARLEAMRYVLSQLRYSGKSQGVVGQPDSLIVGSPAVAGPTPESQPAAALVAASSRDERRAPDRKSGPALALVSVPD
jgi:polyphosphate kinase 2 (PPK2 family)